MLQSRWSRVLASPDWYRTVIPDIERWREALQSATVPVQEACKAQLYDFFEAHLLRGDIALASCSDDTDRERKPVDMVVIHHTSNPPGLRPSRLSAIELIRLYGPHFIASDGKGAGHRKGQPIYSGHVRNGGQVFWPYHWIIRRDGKAERLLEDSEIGWHAGNWDVNCRSVAIALDNDYELSRPSVVELESIARLIKVRYRQVRPELIVGHREVNSRTTCPSEQFLATPEAKGWKSDLLRFWSDRQN